MLAGHAVTIRRGRATLVWRASVEVQPGRVIALLGPNGAGKSTLLAALAGDFAPTEGTVTIDGEALASLRAPALARRRAVMPQTPVAPFGCTAREIVALGRYPHVESSARCAERVAAALAAADVAHLADRTIASLSGGERTRVHFARTLAQIETQAAQGPRYLLLDEPAASLDPSQQHRILGLARDTAYIAGAGVLVVLHDINLAAAYADDAVLMREGEVIEAGAIDAVLRPDALQACFGISIRSIRDPALARPFFAAVMGDASSAISPGGVAQ